MLLMHSDKVGLAAIAQWLEENIQYPVVLFAGDMGSGKTTLIKAWARQLGVEDEVASPTYALVNEYLLQGEPLYHFDFYRIDSEDEALDMGLYEYIESGYRCWIEWPEKIRNLLPIECSMVKISFTEEGRSYEIIQPPNE